MLLHKTVLENPDFTNRQSCETTVNSNDTPQVGQRVEVKVLNIDIAKGRIGLELVKLL